MFGCASSAASRDSRRKRSLARRLPCSQGPSTLRATIRSSVTWRARKTTPMPPLAEQVLDPVLADLAADVEGRAHGAILSLPPRRLTRPVAPPPAAQHAPVVGQPARDPGAVEVLEQRLGELARRPELVAQAGQRDG